MPRLGTFPTSTVFAVDVLRCDVPRSPFEHHRDVLHHIHPVLMPGLHASGCPEGTLLSAIFTWRHKVGCVVRHERSAPDNRLVRQTSPEPFTGIVVLGCTFGGVGTRQWVREGSGKNLFIPVCHCDNCVDCSLRPQKPRYEGIGIQSLSADGTARARQCLAVEAELADLILQCSRL